MIIKMLSKKRFNDFVNGKYIDKKCALVFTYDNGKFVACDDTTDQMWVEEFDHLEDCIGWLKGEFEL